ncbi:hypothetical protein [Alexandriicola marinus]|uniref:hypothetical protein n=1 Tax=Alexandriicola marinus TaxID=2081710 RepID=UPI001EEE455F|nr:hypothetical protein [Alexandriicola marinus]
MTMRIAALVAGLAAGPAFAQEGGAPLSAIDWLSQSVAVEPVAAPGPRGLPGEPPIADSATAPEVTVTPLDVPSPDGTGLLPPDVTGLPGTLWAGSDLETLTDLVSSGGSDTLPAIRDLFVTLLLASADPPSASGPDGLFLLARIDKLLDLGALQPAQALVEAADIGQPRLYRRWFDISLLTGTEDLACEALRNQPDLAPTYPARVFCLARNGDWRGAALTLNTARALGDVTEEEDRLLSRFLDPAISEDADPLPPPSRLSPLVFLMREAIGEGLPTANLPLAFAHADLRSTAAWRNEMIAAERLVRHGSISESQLLAAYTRQRPAASGGVWDRAQAVQLFELALERGDSDEIAATLPLAWSAFEEIRAEVPFARLFAEELRAIETDEATERLIARIGLLSPSYEETALSDLGALVSPLLVGIATGEMTGVAQPATPPERAIFEAFSGAAPPEDLKAILPDERLGEALLRGIGLFDEGLRTDPALVRDALALFREVGLEDVARRAALQYLILDRSA